MAAASLFNEFLISIVFDNLILNKQLKLNPETNLWTMRLWKKY